MTGPTNVRGASVACMQSSAGGRALNRPLTPTEAGEYLGLDEKTVTRWARQGYLPGHPLGEGKRKFLTLPRELEEAEACPIERSAFRTSA